MVICFKHPKYNPKKPPDLLCKECCSAFIRQVTKNQKEYETHGELLISNPVI